MDNVDILKIQVNSIYRQLEQYHALTSYLQPPYPFPPMRGWAISPDFGRLIMDTVTEFKPRTIVELGSGVSSLILGLLAGKQKIERIISIDHDPKYCDVTRKRLKHYHLTKQVELFCCPLKSVHSPQGEAYQWYDLSVISFPEKIDLLLVDGPPGNLQPQSRYMALPALKAKLSDTSVILLDDAGRPDEQKIIGRWLNEMPGFSAEMHPCEKGAARLLKLASAG